MANVANIVDPQFTTYAANLPVEGTAPYAGNTRPVAWTLFEGPAVIVGMGGVSTKFPLPSPDPQHGSSTPLGPQRWPL